MKAQAGGLAYTEPHYSVNNNAAVVQERERKLQTNLINKIDRFLRGDTDGFALTLMNEAQRLSEAAYGSAFLHTIGSVTSLFSSVTSSIHGHNILYTHTIYIVISFSFLILAISLSSGSPHLVGDVLTMQFHECNQISSFLVL